MNSLFALIPIAFVLSLDNFQSSIGLGTTKPPWRRIVQAAIVFSACDALAPLIGVWAGNVLGEYIGDVAEYVGAAALGAYALYLVVHSMRTEETSELDHPLAILGLPLPLSLDNLFAGASLGVVGASPVTVAVVCGCATLIMSMVGLTLGRLAASTVRIRTDLFGGLVLLGMAVLMVVRAMRTDAAVTEGDDNDARPPCYHCGEPYTSVNAVRHTEPVSCVLPSLQRDACLLHVPEHVLRLRGAPILRPSQLASSQPLPETTVSVTV